MSFIGDVWVHFISHSLLEGAEYVRSVESRPGYNPQNGDLSPWLLWAITMLTTHLESPSDPLKMVGHSPK